MAFDVWPAGLEFTKGHGTENDFVLITDPDGDLDLTPEMVRSLCDRRSGIGADGVIRAVRTGALPGAGIDPGMVPWFMDYRNADGSIAEMCGNGIRVYTAYLLAEGLVPPGTDVLAIGTRGGVRTVRCLEVADGDPMFAVDMGPWSAPGGMRALADGFDVTVALAGASVARPGLRVDMPNPHVVVALADDDELARADLGSVPAVDPAPEAGTNVEIVTVHGEKVVAGERIGRISMRVHERGSGETRSCGTGTCAAAVAVRHWAGPGAPDAWAVEVPGGSVEVRIAPDGTVELCGPAVLVYSGAIR